MKLTLEAFEFQRDVLRDALTHAARADEHITTALGLIHLPDTPTETVTLLKQLAVANLEQAASLLLRIQG